MRTLIGAAEPDEPQPFSRLEVCESPYGTTMTWVNSHGPAVVTSMTRSGYSTATSTPVLWGPWRPALPHSPFGP